MNAKCMFFVFFLQSSYNEELVEFVHRAHSVSSEVEDDRTQLLIQVISSQTVLTYILIDLMNRTPGIQSLANTKYVQLL